MIKSMNKILTEHDYQNTKKLFVNNLKSNKNKYPVVILHKLLK